MRETGKVHQDYIEILKKHPDKIIECRICEMQEHILNRDMNSDYHHGFTVGKKGKIMYWYMNWHGKSGNVTIYPQNLNHFPRYISGDAIIRIHLRDDIENDDE